MNRKQFEVDVLDASKIIHSCVLNVIDDERIRLYLCGRSVAAQSDNYFLALCVLRKLMEASGKKILCNGSRKDAYPSPMSLNMARGDNLYLLSLGQPARKKDLVKIFDHAPADKIGTVAEQQSFYERWIKSL